VTRQIVTSSLETLRRECGLSRERLAALSGVSARTIYRIEHEEARPNLGTLALLAAVFDVEPGDLRDPRPAAAGGVREHGSAPGAR